MYTILNRESKIICRSYTVGGLSKTKEKAKQRYTDKYPTLPLLPRISSLRVTQDLPEE